MSRWPLPTQHLSDEAIAAFADGVLGPVARDRARRHLDGCPDCAGAVAVQREAAFALRAAPTPALPTDLVDRLRAVPITTPLTTVSLALDSSGAAVFPAFGTKPSAPPAAGRHKPPFALFTAAAAFVAVGVGMAAGATSHATPVPAAPARVLPAGYHSTDVHGDVTLPAQSALATWSAR
jgi:anti-sigma factor RsiW